MTKGDEAGRRDVRSEGLEGGSDEGEMRMARRVMEVRKGIRRNSSRKELEVRT